MLELWRGRYHVVVTLLRRLGDVVVQQEVVVYVPSSLPEVTRSVKVEVGIGDRLRLELECNKWKYVCPTVSRLTRQVLRCSLYTHSDVYESSNLCEDFDRR